MFLLFVYSFSLTQISSFRSLLLYDFAMNTVCAQNVILMRGTTNTRHDSVFIANWKLKNLFSAQCAYSFTHLSFLSNVCGRVFRADSIQFVYTNTQAHTTHRYHSLTQTLFSAYLSVYSRVYAILHRHRHTHTHTHTQTYATVATATVFIYNFNTTSSSNDSSSAKLLLKRE